MRKLLGFAVLVMAACGDPAGPGGVAGEYALTVVNDTLPIPTPYFTNAHGVIEWVSGTLSLRADGSFTETRAERTTVFADGSTSDAEWITSGTYSVHGTEIRFLIFPDGQYFTGRLDTAALTFDRTGVRFRYDRK